jgi:hypothetical protein
MITQCCTGQGVLKKYIAKIDRGFLPNSEKLTPNMESRGGVMRNTNLALVFHAVKHIRTGDRVAEKMRDMGLRNNIPHPITSFTIDNQVNRGGLNRSIIFYYNKDL